MCVSACRRVRILSSAPIRAAWCTAARNRKQRTHNSNLTRSVFTTKSTQTHVRSTARFAIVATAWRRAQPSFDSIPSRRGRSSAATKFRAFVLSALNWQTAPVAKNTVACCSDAQSAQSSARHSTRRGLMFHLATQHETREVYQSDIVRLSESL